jgi:nicotinamide-nucleotide amidase
MTTQTQMACVESCVAQLMAFCTDHHIRIAVAESCTGGLVSAACTSISGASNWFDRGYVCYNDRAKKEQLGVSVSLLAAFGAVSEQVAIALAINALEKSRAHATLSITGFAGPAGDHDNHPVGTVFFGFASHQQPHGIVLHAHFQGNREEIRDKAVFEGLRFLLRQLTLDQYKHSREKHRSVR